MTINGVELDFVMLPNGNYKLNKPLVYYSKRYKKTVTVEAGFVSDGASFIAEDIVTAGWWVHDKLCTTYKWDDGSYCSGWQSSVVLRDILWSEHRFIRANRWFVATLVGAYWRKLIGREPRQDKPKMKFPIDLA